ncbi:GNAT family N-acetyltransferase [Promicromonospora sp. NPDC050880]|uniref:GNAT family N-acetyltransferase n=1 Tax=Promicromonospora sp. NPDC050880 TaxID=3364406 RepID=UPI003797D274
MSSEVSSGYHVELHDDPATVLAVAGDLLAADPVVWSVVASVTHHAARTLPAGGRPTSPMWWAVVRDARGVVVGVAMRTMPYAPHTVWVPALPDDAARLLARTALDHTARAGEPALTSANGARSAVRAYTDEVLRATGGTVHEGRPDRLWEARTVTRPEPAPPGRARRATLADLALVEEWFAVFHADADAQAGRAPEAEPLRIGGARGRILDGDIWLWDVGDESVQLTAARPPSFGVVRIGPVYTPAAHRGRGYARALVADVAQRVLDAGDRVCLYTDRDNPVSNRTYAAIGFEPVLDQVNLAIDPAPAAVPGRAKES